MTKHPQWATKHKRKRTELRLINGRYYLYEVSSKWDMNKKRSKKITGKLLGRITKEDGLEYQCEGKTITITITITPQNLLPH